MHKIFAKRYVDPLLELGCKMLLFLYSRGVKIFLHFNVEKVTMKES
jgi:hypothetical protein